MKQEVDSEDRLMHTVMSKLRSEEVDGRVMVTVTYLQSVQQTFRPTNRISLYWSLTACVKRVNEVSSSAKQYYSMTHSDSALVRAVTSKYRRLSRSLL